MFDKMIDEKYRLLLYTILTYLTSKNYNKLDNPSWDGTHNDLWFFDRDV